MHMIAHIFAALLLFAAITTTFMAIRLTLEFSLRDMENKYASWVFLAALLWVGFYLTL